MKYIFIFFLLIGQIGLTRSQNFQWTKSYGGSLPDNAVSVFTDQNGSNYLTGGFRSNPLVFDNDSIYANGWVGMYVAKTDQIGAIQWVRRVGGSGTSNGPIGAAIIKDSSGNILTGGENYGGGNVDTVQLNDLGGKDALVFKLNDSGACLWAKIFGGFADDRIVTICEASNQSYLIAGRFQSPVANFDTINLYNNGWPIKDKMFLAKIDSNGNCLWAKQSISGNNIPYKMTTNGMQIYMTGTFYDSLTIGSNTLIDKGNGDIFIAAFDMSGNLKWLKSQGGSGSDEGKGISVDSSGNFYLTGYFSDTAFFDPDTLIAGSSMQDMFIGKYDSLGNLIWLQQLNCSGTAEGNAIISNDDGDIYITGDFAGTAYFGTYAVAASSLQDMFITRYNTNGDCLGVRKAANAVGYDVNMDSNGDCIVTGYYSGSTTFGSISITSQGYIDIFLTKINAFSGIEEEGRYTNNQLLIYANPTTGKCNLSVPDEFLNEQKLILSIFDSNGKLIQQKYLQMTDGKIKLNLEAEAKGIYNVALSNGRKSYAGKIIFE